MKWFGALHLLLCSALVWAGGTGLGTQAEYDPPVDSGIPYSEAEKAYFIDVNGDQLIDLLQFVAGQWLVSLNTGQGFVSQVISGLPEYDLSHAVPVDLKNDGLMDLLTADQDSIVILVSSWDAGNQTYSLSAVDTLIDRTGYALGPKVGDFDGDQLQDLALARNDNWVIHFQRQGQDGFAFDDETLTSAKTWGAQWSHVIDFNGDGVDDLMFPNDGFMPVVTNPNNWHVWLSTVTGLQLLDTTVAVKGYQYSPQVMDINGDGLDDLVEVDNDPENLGWRIYLNNGTSLAEDDTLNNMPSATTVHTPSTRVFDYDGDGNEDLIMAVNQCWNACPAPGPIQGEDLVGQDIPWDLFILRSNGVDHFDDRFHLGGAFFHGTDFQAPDLAPIVPDNDGISELMVPHWGTWRLFNRTIGGS